MTTPVVVVIASVSGAVTSGLAILLTCRERKHFHPPPQPT